VSIGGVVQATCFLALLVLANAPAGYIPERRIIVHKTPLYLPPDLLTQKTPNRMKPAENISLADLLPSQAARASRPAPAPSTRHFEVPAPAVPKAKPAPQIEPPPNLAFEQAPQQLPTGVNNGLPVPAPPPQEAKNNQPFQNIGSDSGPLNPHPTLHVPKPSVDGSIAALAQTPNAKRMIVTDNSMSPHPSAGIPGSTSQSASQHMEVELKSDTEAPDFKAYLARVLAVVRANWRLVTPESVRMGTLRGENTIELIINRDGKIPKLVIGQPSNIPALDQASIAGVSMSNPLPPLPDDFKGQQVRVAFTFKYNVQE
jgi:TonB family protein